MTGPEDSYPRFIDFEKQASPNFATPLGAEFLTHLSEVDSRATTYTLARSLTSTYYDRSGLFDLGVAFRDTPFEPDSPNQFARMSIGIRDKRYKLGQTQITKNAQIRNIFHEIIASHDDETANWLIAVRNFIELPSNEVSIETRALNATSEMISIEESFSVELRLPKLPGYRYERMEIYGKQGESIQPADGVIALEGVKLSALKYGASDLLHT